MSAPSLLWANLYKAYFDRNIVLRPVSNKGIASRALEQIKTSQPIWVFRGIAPKQCRKERVGYMEGEETTP